MLLLDADSAPCPGLPADEAECATMAQASHAMLCALNEARGIPAPPEPPKVRARQRDYIDITPAQVSENPFAVRFGVVPRLIDSVAADFGISHGELIGDGRSRVMIHARAVVVKLLLDRSYSASDIGRRFLRRDHSSILHSRDHFDVYAKQSTIVRTSYERHSRMMREAVL